MRTKVICSPIGCGKHYTIDYLRKNNLKVCYMGLSDYKEIPDRIQATKDSLGKLDIIFLGTNPLILEKLEEDDISHVVIYPRHDMLNEWVGRCYINTRNQKICDHLISMWDDLQNLLESHYKNSSSCIAKYVLTPDQPYILNMMRYIDTLPF